MDKHQQELIERLKASAAEYGVPITTVAEWQVEFRTRDERNARQTVSLTETHIKNAQRVLCWSPEDHDRQLRVNILEGRRARKIDRLAAVAHELEDAKVVLAKLKEDS